MERIRYPGDFEVIFVDDGSTDGTQKILKQFPWVRNIQQRNMGLSFARNVGMEAATRRGHRLHRQRLRGGRRLAVLSRAGDGAIETRGHGRAEPDSRRRLVGRGLRWAFPGGPTHVMIDDRTAEHVPGCNMAFYTWAAKLINGFDPQFRKAGDDVDFIWRLQHLGYTIGFAPSAQVWHYRRNTVHAYLKQQRGYGEAEALLKFKHPDHFNTLGASSWRGRIYGGDQIGVRLGRRRDLPRHFRHRDLFQTIYRRRASLAGGDADERRVALAQRVRRAAGAGVSPAVVGGADDVRGARRPGDNRSDPVADAAPPPLADTSVDRLSALAAADHARLGEIFRASQGQGAAARSAAQPPATATAVGSADPHDAALLEQGSRPTRAAATHQPKKSPLPAGACGWIPAGPGGTWKSTAAAM